MVNIAKPPCDEAIIRSKAASAPCRKSAGRWILAATILGSSMAFIDSTVVNVALPALQKSLGATVADVQWVVEAYALFLAALLLVAGALGDLYGRRLIFAAGVAVFALASAGCGLAQNVGQLIVARGVQGVGAALLVPGSLAIISASFSEEDRGQAIGTWSGFSAITAAIGPVIGGWLIEHVSWRAVFFINLPLAIIVIALVFWRVPESREANRARGLDWLGACLTTMGLGALVYGLIEAPALGFGHQAILAALAGGALALLSFFVVEARTRNPMVPLTLFRSKNFSGANLLTLLLYAALGATLFFLPLNLIQVQGYSATEAGAALLPFILIMFLLSRWSGGLVKRYGAKLPLVTGPFIAALGFVMLSLPGVGGRYWTTFFPAIVVLGLGMAVSVAPLTTTVMNAVKGDHAGIASGINNAISRTAGLLAVAVFGILMAHAFAANFERRLATLDLPSEVQTQLENGRGSLAGMKVPDVVSGETQAAIKQAINESFVAGFRLITYISAGLACLSALAAWALIEGRARQLAKPDDASGQQARL
jgi:EmrB/QacA subfamily drug resistance transporter